MFLQQKISPAPADPMQAKIMMFLPVMFTFLFSSFPAGLVLYWLTNNLISITQQYLITRRYQASHTHKKK
jgi:YidC/Oxa1 family membrane protein insertase